jgi:ABC-2 type transport system ATP-binding protein
MTHGSSAIEVRDVTKRYGDFEAVSGISFSVPAGKVFGLLGPNGAGKTTTIRMIMNITIPDSGSIHVEGEPSTSAASRRIGYLPEERGLYRKMKVLDQLVFLGEIRGLDAKESQRRARSWLERLGLPEWEKKKVEELSKGMQQKIQFIGSVIHDPSVIILDEPFSGLDPVNARVLKEEIIRFREEGKTVVLSTHVMEQAEKLCDEIALINRARLVLNGPVRELKRAHSGNRMVLQMSSPSDALRGVPGVRSVTERDGLVEVELDEALDPSRFLRDATQSCEIQSATPHERSLDEIFVSVVSADARPEVQQ